MRRIAAVLLLAVCARSGAAQDSGEQRPHDAAQAVQEGDVSQWLKYYQRERDVPTPAQPPVPSPEPAVQTEGSAPNR